MTIVNIGETLWVHCDAGSSVGTNQASLGLSGGHNKASAPPSGDPPREHGSVATPRSRTPRRPCLDGIRHTAAPSTPVQWMPCHCHHLWTARPRAAVCQLRVWRGALPFSLNIGPRSSLLPITEYRYTEAGSMVACLWRTDYHTHRCGGVDGCMFMHIQAPKTAIFAELPD